MNWRVLATARAFWVSGDRAQKQLEDAGCVVVRPPRAGPLNEDELIPLLRDCQAVIASSDAYSPRTFAACPDLKIVARCGVGFDSVDVPAATAAGVVVTTTPGAMTEAVADFAFGLMLGIARSIPEGDSVMRAGEWREIPGVLLHQKTLGLVGCGSIGQAVARRAAGFDMRVIAYDPAWAGPVNGAIDPSPIEFVGFDQLLAEADFVSLHAPNTPETRNMFDAARFARMKPTAYFINTARGALVDEQALVQALESGTIAGAAVDVYAQEPPPPDHPLRKAPHCVLAPHNAFNAIECVELMNELCADAILELMRGECPRTILNPDVWGSHRSSS